VRLAIENVSRHYGALRAVSGVNLTVDSGTRLALIGPNGAGKSTLLKVVAGREVASSGRIVVDGIEITRWSQPRRARLGIAMTFQTSSVFRSLSVSENVAIAAQRTLGLGHRWWRRAGLHSDVRSAVDSCTHAVRLSQRVDVPASALSHGERRRLEIALAIASDPSVLLLDEPTAGLTAQEASSLIEIINELPESMSLIIVEHNLDVVAALATEVTVLQAGAILAQGSWAEITASEEVQKAYLSRAGRAVSARRPRSNPESGL
jgi:branched-chain amino acid transport system ATP-binding protein